ncbi:MAG: nucleoside-diphosphate kinase [Candidatus Liptonbacteria bacterium]|nr:nucleoside-diphosphate kinase [Candidatus Liptonbacteria bacterium]
MSDHLKKEKTFVIIKPDGVQRSLIGEIICRFERAGLKLLAMKMVVPDAAKVEAHYLTNPDWRRITGEKTIESYRQKGKKPPSEDPLKVTEIILSNLKRYMTAGPVVAMVWQGMHAVDIVRKLVGGTEPLTSDVGTIRGDYTMDSYEVSDLDGRGVRNLVHASGTVDEAEKEIGLWFAPEELIKYNLVQDAILYDVNLDGILE